MVKGVTPRTDIQQALREIIMQQRIYPKMVHANDVADFFSFMLTQDKRAAIVWKNKLRGQLCCTMISMIDIQDIDSLVDAI
jgi:L-lysine 2,3-aminomutase